MWCIEIHEWASSKEISDKRGQYCARTAHLMSCLANNITLLLCYANAKLLLIENPTLQYAVGRISLKIQAPLKSGGSYLFRFRHTTWKDTYYLIPLSSQISTMVHSITNTVFGFFVGRHVIKQSQAIGTTLNDQMRKVLLFMLIQIHSLKI